MVISIKAVADALRAYNLAPKEVQFVLKSGSYEGIAEAALTAIDPIVVTQVDVHCPRCGAPLSAAPEVENVQLADRSREYAAYVSFATARVQHYCGGTP